MRTKKINAFLHPRHQSTPPQVKLLTSTTGLFKFSIARFTRVSLAEIIPMNHDYNPTLQSERQPDPIDCYIGSRIQIRRTLLGLSQEQLGAHLGLTFQQVQKYENGSDRVGAPRLFEISRILNVSVLYFYDDRPAETLDRPLLGSNPPETRRQKMMPDERILSRETLELVRAYYSTPPAVREQMVALINSLGEPG
jgi:transcriptional regulator with XRE-family HTH domain